ncbi:hypothetical protein [Flavobacterium hydatis]|uniref:hypothetical protein n=1 Tax=Flavobacterium hydatis TaxID=991 RepID=UPI000B03C1F7|nr:hypothetical protein [Flavobacterium hydatis]
MKTTKEKKAVNKFDLEKFEVAKLKNLHVIEGGNAPSEGDTIDGTNNKGGGSSKDC